MRDNTFTPASDLLAGKVAIVTGAGRGLGRAHALALAAHGAAVVVNDLGGGVHGTGTDPAPAEEVAAEIRARGGRAIADASDIAVWDRAGALVDAALEAYGRLDIVVNNAGIFSFAPLHSVDRATWERTIQVNLIGTAALTHWAAAHWRRQGPQPGRAIVNTSAPGGTNPLPGSAHYCASKAAVAALSVSAAIELAELGVRVNAIAPIARTRMSESVAAFRDLLKKSGDFDRMAPECSAPLVVYLASAQCAFSGRVFGIEGDKVYLFNGYSADTEVANDNRAWTPQALSQALAGLDRQDRGWNIAPLARFPGPTPPDQVLQALDAVQRGEDPGTLVPLLSD
jgi:NAD(P)-dependent dehydrogenase (short-subunit alcohol dehydrogenase family)